MEAAEHITRVRQLATWMRGQRWSDTDALLAMASVLGLMAKEFEGPDSLLVLFNRYAAGVSTIASAYGGDAAEKRPPPAPRPDNGPPVAYASTLPSAADKNFRPRTEHDVAILDSSDLSAAEKKFSDDT